jgi:hypothetical protein
MMLDHALHQSLIVRKIDGGELLDRRLAWACSGVGGAPGASDFVF